MAAMGSKVRLSTASPALASELKRLSTTTRGRNVAMISMPIELPRCPLGLAITKSLR